MASDDGGPVVSEVGLDSDWATPEASAAGVLGGREVGVVGKAPMEGEWATGDGL